VNRSVTLTSFDTQPPIGTAFFEPPYRQELNIAQLRHSDLIIYSSPYR